MVVALHPKPGIALVHVPAHVDFTAEHGVDAPLFRLRIEIHDAVHDAVVRDGARVHSQLLDAVEQGADPVCAVQKAVFGV